jgi:hypothetical protein
VTSADFGYPFKGLWFPIIWLFSLLTLSIPNEDYSSVLHIKLDIYVLLYTTTFRDVVHYDEFLSLPCETVCKLISSDRLTVITEEQVSIGLEIEKLHSELKITNNNSKT